MSLVYQSPQYQYTTTGSTTATTDWDNVYTTILGGQPLAWKPPATAIEKKPAPQDFYKEIQMETDNWLKGFNK